VEGVTCLGVAEEAETFFLLTKNSGNSCTNRMCGPRAILFLGRSGRPLHEAAGLKLIPAMKGEKLSSIL